MPLCGFNAKMIQGITMFAEGLFEATAARAAEEKISLPEALKIELRDIGLFLQALEDKHQELKRQMPPAETAAGVADLAFVWHNEQE
jgi:hypothetical protein